MTINVDELRKNLCHAFCQDVRISTRGGNVKASLPISARDGDLITVYISRGPAGWTLSDKGVTVMKLSYENDLKSLFSGSRGRLFQQMVKESGVEEDDGELKLSVPANDLMRGLFSLAQAATRVESLGMWTKTRVESTFKDDLRQILIEAVSENGFIEDYLVPGIDHPSLYPVDFYVKTMNKPLYLFGVNNGGDAKIATIVIQQLINNKTNFESMVVCSDFAELPKSDGRRLMNAANDMIANVTDVSDIKRKILNRVG